MPRSTPPPLPPTPPTEWPPSLPNAPEPGRGWLGAPEREAWTGWQVAVVTAVALLAGLAIGLGIGLRIDRDADQGASPPREPWLRTPIPVPGVPGPAPGTEPLGSPANPVPLRTTFILGGYSLQVLAVDSDASVAIAGFSDLNRAPRPGEAYLLVTVELTYDGPLTGNPRQVLLSAADRAGATYLEHRDGCGSIPEPLSAHPEMAPGTSVAGNVCFAVPDYRLEGMTLVAEVLAGYPVHFRLVE